MLFNSQVEGIKESTKERNLYNKIFCGYLFNEMIDGYEERFEIFLDKLLEKYLVTCKEFNLVSSNVINQIFDELFIEMKKKAVHVDFDHHINIDIQNHDNGEVGDICIFSPSSLIAIEVKYLETWKFEKDIFENAKRISRYNKNSLQVLLVKESTWNGAKQSRNRRGSQYTKLLNYLKTKVERPPFIVLFWEDILDIFKELTCDEVYNYLFSILQPSSKYISTNKSL